MSAPLVYFAAMHFSKAWKLFEKLIFVTVAVLVTLHILPESVEVVGWKASIVAFLGMFVPSLLERMWHHSLHKIHFGAILLTIIGIGVHNLMDGAALASPELNIEFGSSLLPYAVVLHRIPEGLLIVTMLYPKKELALGYVLSGCLLRIYNFRLCFRWSFVTK